MGVVAHLSRRAVVLRRVLDTPVTPVAVGAAGWACREGGRREAVKKLRYTRGKVCIDVSAADSWRSVDLIHNLG